MFKMIRLTTQSPRFKVYASACIIFMLICLTSFRSNAQFNIIATSPDFEEYTTEAVKILTLKNKETALLCSRRDYDFVLNTFDINHQPKITAVIKNQLKFGIAAIINHQQIMEVDGKIVIFREALQNHSLKLYRYIINPATGALEEEVLLETVKGYGLNLSKAGFNPTEPGFTVRQDEHSGDYAIAAKRSFDDDPDKRLEIIHYSKKHKVISRAFYKASGNPYKYYKLIDMKVRADQEVLIATLGRDDNINGRSYLKATLYYGKLSAGQQEFQLDPLADLDKEVLDAGIIEYDEKNAKTYLLCIVEQREKRSSRHTRLYIMDKDMQLLVTRTVTTDKAQKVSDKYYTKKAPFLKTAQQLFIHDNESYTILFEEQDESLHAERMGEVRDMALVQYDKNGAELKSYYVPKNHKYDPELMFKEKKKLSPYYMFSGRPYGSFAYIPAGDQGYFLFNELAKNLEYVAENKKINAIASFGACEAFVFPLDDQKILPGKRLFSEDIKTLAVFNGSAYDPETKILTLLTLNLKRKAQGKKANLVWIKVD